MAVGQQAAAGAAKSSLSIFCVTLLLISTQLLIQSPTVLAAPPALVSSQQSIKEEKVVIDNINSRKMHGGLKDNKGTRSTSDGCGALDAIGPGDANDRARLGNPYIGGPGIHRGPCLPGRGHKNRRIHP
ncbi:uncharacterized protein LOC131163661 [Malania oleifera]|uniref:uncharacterized protein LOC131163661 n=1 Tax=Malania oleifera TaxID=397392 RepID=UPI0025AEA65F|nr:uncharacterized protein LOC131163661 [Malania oleifera]